MILSWSYWRGWVYTYLWLLLKSFYQWETNFTYVKPFIKTYTGPVCKL